jgi:hypothetical protein
MSITFGAAPGCGEKLEAFDPPLPGSEQFRLQQSRAIETSAVLPDDCAFLQQSGMLVIGQVPSLSCAPAPTAPPSMAASKMIDVSHFLIIEYNYI